MKKLLGLIALTLLVSCGKGPEGTKMAECIVNEVEASQTLEAKAKEILTRVERGCGASMAALKASDDISVLDGVFTREIEATELDPAQLTVITIENGRYWSINVVDIPNQPLMIIATTDEVSNLPSAALESLDVTNEVLIQSTPNGDLRFEKRLPSLDMTEVENAPITLVDINGQTI